ncbi:hypothetical protein [Polaromonas jejuensis]|uniref:hypothetical protein n=1 Tax=Polaromonas jejuensis TaxID=457502 RepID=UPI0012EE2D93|nr:hypothetical protein [Polaromonas jejuensis]
MSGDGFWYLVPGAGIERLALTRLMGILRDILRDESCSGFDGGSLNFRRRRGLDDIIACTFYAAG